MAPEPPPALFSPWRITRRASFYPLSYKLTGTTPGRAPEGDRPKEFRGRDLQMAFDAGPFAGVANLSQTKHKQTQQNKPVAFFKLCIASWQASALSGKHTDRRRAADRRRPGLAGITQSDFTRGAGSHIATDGGRRREEGITRERERERGGNNSPWCNVRQDLRFLPAALLHRRLAGSGPVQHAFVLTWESDGDVAFSPLLATALT